MLKFLQQKNRIFNKIPIIQNNLVGIFLFLLLIIFSIPISTSAQTPNGQNYEHVRAKVTVIIEEKEEVQISGRGLSQRLKAIIVEGSEKNKEIEFNYSIANFGRSEYKVKVGDELILSKGFAGENVAYNVVSFYRLPNLILITVIFLITVILVAGFKGFSSMFGLVVSIVIIAAVLIPSILQGQDPYLTSIWICFLLAIINLYLAHGFNQRTTIALISVLISILIAAVTAPIFTNLVHLFGIASDEAFYLQAWEGGRLDLRGLFLGGLILGALGVLDDVTTAQSATIEEIHKANPSMSIWQLYRSGLKVGREHIVSMVNTLALAYVGVSLPLLLSFVITKGQPWWAILSSDLVAEELVRTLAGSISLVLAVPICNFLAAWWFGRKKPKMLSFYQD